MKRKTIIEFAFYIIFFAVNGIIYAVFNHFAPKRIEIIYGAGVAVGSLFGTIFTLWKSDKEDEQKDIKVVKP